MSKRYISKITGNIATEVENYYTIHTSDDDPLSGKYVIGKWMIEDNPEVWEEVQEDNDRWIQDFINNILYVDRMYNIFKVSDNKILSDNIRRLLKQYFPQQKKFTDRDIEDGIRDIYTDIEHKTVWLAIKYFLKKHNLYDE